MTKEQFNKLKVGDIIEYNLSGVLVGCQFRITKLNKHLVAEGVVTKKGSSGSMLSHYEEGRSIAGNYDNITLVTQDEVKTEPFATLELSVQEAAVLFRLTRRVSGDPSKTIRNHIDSICDKLAEKFPKSNCLDHVEMFDCDGSIRALTSQEALDSELVKIGLLKAPEKPEAAARHKVKGPDGKWAPKNYRVVTYPEHGKGEPVKRHVLWGDFVKGSSGTNVYVEEWDAAKKKWLPKTYSLTKVGVAE